MAQGSSEHSMNPSAWEWINYGYVRDLSKKILKRSLTFEIVNNKGTFSLVKMIFKSNNGKPFTHEQAIDLMVSLSATDANSEKKWRGFYNSLSQIELQSEWDEYWKD